MYKLIYKNSLPNGNTEVRMDYTEGRNSSFDTVELVGNHLDKSDKELIAMAQQEIIDRINPDNAIKRLKEELTTVKESALREFEEAKKQLQEMIETVTAETQDLKSKQNKMNQAFVLSDNLTEEQKAIILEQFPEYQVGMIYNTNDVVDYQGKLYKVLQDHVSQGDWIPDSTPSLYTEFLNFKTTVTDPETGEETTVEVISDFKQPTGAHDAYKLGDKVLFDGKIYESIIDNNAYSPTDYPQGWKEIGA